jgi:hypothetical protein
VVAIATETRQRLNSEEKWARRAWYWLSSGGRLDQEVEVGTGVDWKRVGDGGRQ